VKLHGESLLLNILSAHAAAMEDHFLDRVCNDERHKLLIYVFTASGEVQPWNWAHHLQPRKSDAEQETQSVKSEKSDKKEEKH
jgi:hypothetical protein